MKTATQAVLIIGLLAGIARADGMKTAWTSLRLGAVLFFVPAFFVLQPSLIMQGSPLDIIYHASTAAIGIILLTSGLEGYLIGVGRLTRWERGVLIVTGFMTAFPGTIYTVTGLGAAAAVIIFHKMYFKQSTIGGQYENDDNPGGARGPAD